MSEDLAVCINVWPTQKGDWPGDRHLFLRNGWTTLPLVVARENDFVLSWLLGNATAPSTSSMP
jgi:hypothetical protein